MEKQDDLAWLPGNQRIVLLLIGPSIEGNFPSVQYTYTLVSGNRFRWLPYRILD